VKILILGSNGQLGRCLRDQFSATNYQVIFSSRSENDVSDLAVTEKYLIAINPDIIVNATAYTAVDKAEQDQEAAEQINHLAVANIAKICVDLDCWFVHISTDYVFDGLSQQPYSENHECNPKGVYGATKRRGELAIKRVGCEHLIIRTAWVFSEYGSNFLKTMLRLGAEKEELSIVGDQIGCPTYAQDIARVIISLLPLIASNKISSGIYNYCGDESCSWFEFAEEIFEQGVLSGYKVPQRLRVVNTSDYPTAAARPHYSVLDCQLIETIPGVSRSNWRLGIKLALQKLPEK